MSGLTYWWKKYQDIKKTLEPYMKENNIKTVESAINNLLKQDSSDTPSIEGGFKENG